MSAGGGRFVWFNLVTPDVEGAKSFYREVAGWRTVPFGASYELWTVGEEAIGGVTELPGQTGAGARAHWLGYVITSDIDDAVVRARTLGGNVLLASMDIPGGGHFAELVDPQGAAFGIYEPAVPHRRDTTRAARLGEFGWDELHTVDWQSAWSFYSGLFGWKHTSSIEMGPEMGTYFMFGAGADSAMGGMFNGAGLANVSPHWMHYIKVQGADEAARRIDELGGTILHGPAGIPGGGRIAQCIDPQGARFAVVSEES